MYAPSEDETLNVKSRFEFALMNSRCVMKIEEFIEKFEQQVNKMEEDNVANASHIINSSSKFEIPVELHNYLPSVRSRKA